MADLPAKRQNPLSKLLSSFCALWNAQETLELRNIRPGALQYFFAFPLAMILINIQDHIWAGDIRIYGFPSTTVLYLAFTAGAVSMLVFANAKNISAVSKISATLTIAGLVPWLFLSGGYPALACAIGCMAGIGGCLSSSSFSFVFALNNTERFFGSAFVVLMIGLAELGGSLIQTYPAVRKGLALLLIAGICCCMYFSKSRDYCRERGDGKRKFGPSIWLALFIFFSYFTIRIMNFYVPTFQNQTAAQAWGALTLLPVFICILLQAVFKYSIWTMCNVFFLSSIMSYVLWYAGLPEAAYLFAGMDHIGLFVSFYLIGSVTNKFCDFRMHKLLVLLCMPVIGMLYVTSDLLLRTTFSHIVALAVSAVLFILFLLFSPAFSRHLFLSDWSEEFRKLHMTGCASGTRQAATTGRAQPPSLEDTKLSLREKQVVLLLLQGMTLRQVAPELGLTFSTVSTYSKTIYKKLGINSRAELFLLFGCQPSAAACKPTSKE